MAERNVEALSPLFHEDAVFVHMGGTMSRSQELDVPPRQSPVGNRHSPLEGVG